jgi:hypothetical protein
MEDDLEDLINKILTIYEILTIMITAALILRVILLPSWENFGEAMLFVFLIFLINWSRRK